jgi:hypothetical protein
MTVITIRTNICPENASGCRKRQKATRFSIAAPSISSTPIMIMTRLVWLNAP